MADEPNGYCNISDLLLGDLELPFSVSPAQYITAASEEIDARIGVLYSVPIIIEPSELDKYKATVSFLRSVNARLATGRLIMSMAAALELTTVHAYARDLVKSAYEDIQAIIDRKYILEGAEANNNPVQDFVASHVEGYNQDRYSAVDQFYGLVDPGSTVDKPAFMNRTFL